MIKVACIPRIDAGTVVYYCYLEKGFESCDLQKRSDEKLCIHRSNQVLCHKHDAHRAIISKHRRRSDRLYANEERRLQREVERRTK